MHCDIKFTKEEKNIIKFLKNKRNEIMHYEFEFNKEIAENIIGNSLSLILVFTKKHLNIDLQSELEGHGTWDELLEFYGFWKAHSTKIEAEIQDKYGFCLECPKCGLETFIVDSEKCECCGYWESLTECEKCNAFIFDSEIIDGEISDIDEYGKEISGGISICPYCNEELN